jgi:hypothetical protein
MDENKNSPTIQEETTVETGTDTIEKNNNLVNDTSITNTDDNELDVEVNSLPSEENIEEDLILSFNNFLDAIAEGTEYYYFDSYTKEDIGTEEIYKANSNSYIHNIISNDFKYLKDVTIEQVILYEDRARGIIKAKKIVNEMESEEYQSEVYFIYEGGEWKINFYYIPSIRITPINPKPGEELLVREEFVILLRAFVESFFPLEEIDMTFNGRDVEYIVTINKKFKKYILYEFPFRADSTPFLHTVFQNNYVTVNAKDIFGGDEFLRWDFIVNSPLFKGNE